MARKPKVSMSDAVSSAATDFINEAPDAKHTAKRDGSKVHNPRTGMVRIAFEVDPDERVKLKILAANRQVTISELLRKFVQDEIRKAQ